MTNAASTVNPALWFLNTRVVIRTSYEEGTDDISVLEHFVPSGDSPPLHVHRTEDEVFLVLEGEFRFLVGGRELRAGPGASLLAPKGVPHTYRAESPAGGRFLTITAATDFERFVRALGQPAGGPGLPPPAAPTPEMVAQLTAAASGFGIDLCGPPLS